MMEQMELVESLREKTGCSYAEAKAAIDEAGDDLLECLCWLESHGKGSLIGASCSTENREIPKESPDTEPKSTPHKTPIQDGFRSLWDGLTGILRKCNRTELVMTGKNGHKELGIPLTLFIILLLVAFWVVAALLVVALFFGNRFSVQGALGYDDVNEALGRATDFAEDIKDSLKNDTNT